MTPALVAVLEHLRPKRRKRIFDCLLRDLGFVVMYAWTEPAELRPWKRYATTIGILRLKAERSPLAGQP